MLILCKDFLNQNRKSFTTREKIIDMMNRNLIQMLINIYIKHGKLNKTMIMINI